MLTVKDHFRAEGQTEFTFISLNEEWKEFTFSQALKGLIEKHCRREIHAIFSVRKKAIHQRLYFSVLLQTFLRTTCFLKKLND